MAGAENAAVVVEVRDGAVAQLADHVARVQARIVGVAARRDRLDDDAARQAPEAPVSFCALHR